MNRPKNEVFQITGSQLTKKVKQLVNEGDIERLIIASADNTPLIEIHLQAVAMRKSLAPVLTAVEAVAGSISRVHIIVERSSKKIYI